MMVEEDRTAVWDTVVIGGGLLGCFCALPP